MLEIRNLEKSFGNKQVLFGVDLTAQQGHILGLVGKNGAGKTTIFHSILRFLDYSGEIRLGGKAITQETYKEIGYLPEERSLMPKLTIFEQVRYLAALKGMSTAEVKEKLPTWMEKLQVKGKLTDKIKSLSKGNQQKVQLIITLIHEPKLIIMDEPFVGLDPKASHLLKGLMRDLCDRGGAIFFSTHVLEVAEKLCDKIAIIKAGKLVVSGNTQDVIGDDSLEEVFLELEDDNA